MRLQRFLCQVCGHEFVAFGLPQCPCCFEEHNLSRLPPRVATRYVGGGTYTSRRRQNRKSESAEEATD